MHISAANRSEKDYTQRHAHWTKLVHALRARLFEHEVEGSLSRTSLTEPLPNEFIATANGAYLSVWLQPEDGSGSWNQISRVDACEPWSLSPDGAATLSGRTLTIPELAEAFALKLRVPSQMTPHLHRELWTSWASLLRAYAGAHGLSSPHHAVVEVSPDTITLRVDTRTLTFTHTTFEQPNGTTLPFSLNEDGTATLDTTTEEMDMAAERVAREMMHA